MDAQDDPDAEQGWRCKACGAHQPDPDPPCERCWNTTFVAGEGASDVAGPDSNPTLGTTPAQVARVKMATVRSAVLTGVLTGVFVFVHETVPLGRPLDGLVLTGLVATGGVTAIFLLAAVLATVADNLSGFVAE